MSLAISLRSEIRKTKRTASVYLTIFAAAFAPFMSMLELMLDGVEATHRKDIFNELLTTRFQMTALLAFPIFLILVCTVLPQLEYRNHTWKQLMATPQRKTNVFLAKFINVQWHVLLFFIINHLMMLCNAMILHYMDPALHIFSQSVNAADLLMSRVNSYLALLALCSIQFWLGFRFRNFMVPVGIGIALWFMGTIVVMQKLEFAAYFPYSFHAYGSFPKYDPQFGEAGGISVAIALVVLAAGLFDFSRRSMSR